MNTGIADLRLSHWADRPARTLSTGNRQRLGLACALLGEPDLLVLDEPTTALDPAGVVLVRTLLRAAAARGTAVLVSSHHLDEMARIANHISVMHRGRIVGALDPTGVDLERTFFDLVLTVGRSRRRQAGGLMLAAIRVEWLKLRRSRISLITTVLVGIGVPALTAGFLAAATRGPADTPLAIKVNAMLIGEGWPAYLGMLAQILSVMSFLGVGFVVAWCFGREFTDHTITGLYALPTSLTTIAAAKYTVLLAWSLALSLITLAAAFALAPLAGLPAPTTDVLEPAAKVLAVGVNGALLAYPLAFIASAARGYLPAVAGLILIVVITQILTVHRGRRLGPVRRHQPVGRDGRPRSSRHHRATPPRPHPADRRRRRRIHPLVVAPDAGGLTWQQRQ